MALLEVKALCKSFDELQVLRGVSFSMEGCLLVFSAVLIELQPASTRAEAAKRAKGNLFFTIFSCKENFTVMQSPKTLCRGYPY